MKSALEVLVQVVNILERLSVRYHLGGSFASSVHGVPRQTRDLDVVVDLEPWHVSPLVEALRNDYYVDEGVASDAVARRSSFNAIHFQSGFKVVFFVKGNHQFDEVELQRSVSEQILDDPPKTARFKSAEDTVLRKLQWYQDGDCVADRQWSDVIGILKAQAQRRHPFGVASFFFEHES